MAADDASMEVDGDDDVVNDDEVNEEDLSMEEKIARVLNKLPRDKKAFGDLVSKDDDLTYDLGNLTAYDSHQLDLDQYKQQGKQYLIDHSRQNVQLLIGHLFRLPSKQTKKVFLQIYQLHQHAYQEKNQFQLKNHKPCSRNSRRNAT